MIRSTAAPIFSGCFKLAGGHPLLELLQALAGSLHRLFPLGLLVAAPLVGVDDDDPQIGIARQDFLGTGPRRVGLPFLGIDASRDNVIHFVSSTASSQPSIWGLRRRLTPTRKPCSSLVIASMFSSVTMPRSPTKTSRPNANRWCKSLMTS